MSINALLLNLQQRTLGLTPTKPPHLWLTLDMLNQHSGRLPIADVLIISYNGANYSVAVIGCQTHGYRMPLIFVFLDGVGLAPASSHNPLTTAATPTLQTLLGGPLTSEQVQHRSGVLLRPLDTTLGVTGLPQSGTGQVALLTGINAPACIGRHQPYYPPVALQPLLAEQSIFRQAQAHGLPSIFANAFTPAYWQALATRRIRRSASVIAAEGAGLRLRGLADLWAGQALMWDITGAVIQTQDIHPCPPLLSPHAAGTRLVTLSLTAPLVFFECFLPDLAGHHRLPFSAETVMAWIDDMLGGLLAALPSRVTLLLTSDHGNIEDSVAPGHTRNPVPLLVVGPASYMFASVVDTAGVAAPLIDALVAAV